MTQKASASAKKGDVLLLVGTMKGAFFLRADGSRQDWRVEGPHFPGESVYALLHDKRGGRHRTFAGSVNNHWGPTLRLTEAPTPA